MKQKEDLELRIWLWKLGHTSLVGMGGRLDVQPQDMQMLKKFLTEAPMETHTASMTARMVKGIVFYESKSLDMTQEGEIKLGLASRVLPAHPHLPEREI